MKAFVIVPILFACCVGVGLWARFHGWLRPGNGRRYDIRRVRPNPDSPLRGKTIFCLGSSVTAGMSSMGVSFTDCLSRADGCVIIREAVAASTMADLAPNSYLRRLKKHPAVRRPVDCFLCQLSTNDATFYSQLCRISDSFDPKDFDTNTTAGGIESVIAFAREAWDCPIVFFTGTKYDNPRYHKLVNLLLQMAEKWGITVIDLWHDPEMNRVSPEDYRLYMNDGVHPTKAGYLLWWTPALQRGLYRVFGE